MGGCGDTGEVTYNVVGSDLARVCRIFKQVAYLVELHECRACETRCGSSSDHETQQDLQDFSSIVLGSWEEKEAGILTAHDRECDHGRVILEVISGAVRRAHWKALRILHTER